MSRLARPIFLKRRICELMRPLAAAAGEQSTTRNSDAWSAAHVRLLGKMWSAECSQSQ
jgi:hypothetical protein